jgi:outer membrane murein-binding lipoprotein Lpp
MTTAPPSTGAGSSSSLLRAFRSVPATTQRVTQLEAEVDQLRRRVDELERDVDAVNAVRDQVRALTETVTEELNRLAGHSA